MSVSTKIIALEQSSDAIIHSASSEASGFLADNMVSPINNCYWKSNQSDYQHQIVVNLQTMKYSNALVIVHGNEENSNTLAGLNADVEYANTSGGTFTSVSNPVDPGITDGVQVKVFRYDLADYINQYWRVTLSGYESGDYYPPDPTKIYSLWVARERELVVPHAWPVIDNPDYPIILPETYYKSEHRIPLAHAPSIELTRSYLLTGDDIDTFEQIMISFLGMPFVIQEGDGDPFIASLIGDFIIDQVTPDIQIAHMNLKTIPVLEWDKSY